MFGQAFKVRACFQLNDKTHLHLQKNSYESNLKTMEKQNENLSQNSTSLQICKVFHNFLIGSVCIAQHVFQRWAIICSLYTLVEKCIKL